MRRGRAASLVAGLVQAAILSMATVPAAADDLPPWAREALKAPAAPAPPSADAVVLFDEVAVLVEGGDRYRSLHRRVVRVLSSAGAAEAVARAYYRTDGDKVRSLDAWIVSTGGEVRRLPGKGAVDRAILDGDVYTEARVRTLSGADAARPGSVFAHELEVEYRSPFAQHQYRFQEEHPVLHSRFALTPPEGWAVSFAVAGRDTIVPRVTAGTWVWELHDLPAVANEPLRPPIEAIAARVAVNVVAPAGEERAGGHRAVRRWEDASAWMAEQVASLGGPDARVRAKAAAITAGAATTEEKIRAIAAFSQAVNYVSIQMGLARGGGYVPRPAGDVLTRAYGDCKDKANLMRSLLEAAGIESHLVAIRASEGEHVLPDHPTLTQFDHCIVAVRSEAPADAVVEHPARGRLVLFDPTDPSTPWGSLPAREHDAWALLVLPQGGPLVRVPPAPPGSNHRARVMEGDVDGAGLFTGSLRYELSGGAASSWRSSIRSLGAKAIERERTWWLGPVTSAAVVDSFDLAAPLDDAVRLSARFRLPKAATPMAGRLLVVETGRLTTLSVPALADTPRVFPIEIPSGRYEEEITLRLPDGYAPDDVPGPVSVDAPYGAVRCEVTREGGVLKIRRSLETRKSLLPPGAYPDVRRFYASARDAFGLPIVLVRR